MEDFKKEIKFHMNN